jgi:type IV fimbrial biogenesis protein FimT
MPREGSLKSRKFYRCNHRRIDTGMTVLEVLIVLAALVIVVLISVPGSTMLLEKYRLSSASSQLSGSLELALTEASSRSSTVRVCPSSNAKSCRTDGNWNHGWIVFSDGNADGAVQDIELIRAFNAPHQKISIVANGAVLSRASFNSTGLVAANDAVTGQFQVCLKGSGASPTVLNVDSDGWISRSSEASTLCGQD